MLSVSAKCAEYAKRCSRARIICVSGSASEFACRHQAKDLLAILVRSEESDTVVKHANQTDGGRNVSPGVQPDIRLTRETPFR